MQKFKEIQNMLSGMENKEKEPYSIEITNNVYKVEDLIIFGLPFKFPHADGTFTLAIMEINNFPMEELPTLLKDYPKITVRLDEWDILRYQKVPLTLRYLGPAPRGNTMCWNSREAYFSDFELQNRHDISLEDASKIIKCSFE